MTERAQALEAAIVAVLHQMEHGEASDYHDLVGQACESGLRWCIRTLRDALEAVPPPPPVGSPTTEDIPQLVQRFDLVSVSFAYTSDHEMERADDGEWVRFDDVFPPASLSTVEPTVHNDLCSWCLTQADHVAASEECYERNSERGRIDSKPPVEPAGASEPPSDYIDIVFDGPPASESGRFIEVENAQGASIRVGEWVHRPDGYWALRLPAPVSPVEPTPPTNLLGDHLCWACDAACDCCQPDECVSCSRCEKAKPQRAQYVATCETNGHIYGHEGVCVFCQAPKPADPVEPTPAHTGWGPNNLRDCHCPNCQVEPTPEPPVHNDLCSWCLTQADHVAASEECYERNSQRGRSAPVSTGEPAPAVEREGMTAPKNECGKCRMLGSIGPCDEHGPLGVSPSPVLEPTPEPPKCVCSACEPLVDPGQRPSLEDINRLEKAAWDSKTDRVLVWYRDQIGLYQQRIRETERAWQLERKQKPTGAPAPCVWVADGEGYLRPGCTDAHLWGDYVETTEGWQCCPYCEAPLTVER